MTSAPGEGRLLRDFPEGAGPEYTECRPSYPGQLVLDAEARRLSPVPVGIIS